MPLVVVLLMFAACKNDIATINKITFRTTDPIETGKDEEIIYSDSAHMIIKIITPLLKRFNKDTSYMVFPEGVHVLFYDDSGKVKTEMTSKYAIRYESIGRMEAKNNVVLKNYKGETLYTEHLIWDQEKQKIFSNERVRIQTKEQLIIGDGLESNEDFSNYRIKHPTGNLSVADQDKKE